MSCMPGGPRVSRQLASRACLLAVLLPLPLATVRAQAQSAPTQAELVAYLKDHSTSPEDYVVGKFKDHDLVLLGEMHRVKHDVLLVQSLIPRLYAAGVYTLGMEFANFADQAAIDSLTSWSRYDESVARRIVFDMWSTWGYVEYMDIFRAAWALNRTLPAGARRFRLIGLNYAPNYALLTGPIDQATDEQRRAIFYNGDGDAYMARIVLREIIRKGDKALLYTGIHHAFTHFRQPVYDYQAKRLVRLVDNRMGNYLYHRLGDRTFLIALHSPWPTIADPARYAPPMNDAMDELLSRPHERRGFDVAGSPFGRLTDSVTVYTAGHPGFTLADFCDGYIYQRPFRAYEGVTTDTLFVNADNLAGAVEGILNFESRAHYTSPADFIKVMREDADIPARFTVWGVFNGPHEKSAWGPLVARRF
jgi:hypothetical protein